MEGMRAAVRVLQPAERRTMGVLRGRSTTARLSARAPAPSLSRRGRMVHIAASVRTPVVGRTRSCGVLGRDRAALHSRAGRHLATHRRPR
jgi:hypothetical protein